MVEVLVPAPRNIMLCNHCGAVLSFIRWLDCNKDGDKMFITCPSCHLRVYLSNIDLTPGGVQNDKSRTD